MIFVSCLYPCIIAKIAVYCLTKYTQLSCLKTTVALKRKHHSKSQDTTALRIRRTARTLGQRFLFTNH